MISLGQTSVDAPRLVAPAFVASLLILVATLFIAAGGGRPAPDLRPSSVGTSLLWPGTLEYAGEALPEALRFVASNRRYFADLSSSGFMIRGDGSARSEVGVEFAGANPGLSASPGVAGAHQLSVYGGPEGERRIRRTASAVYRNVYAGIDAQYRVSDGDLEFDFLIAPGASVAPIELRPSAGARFARATGTDDIVVARGASRYRIKKPVAFQDIDGSRRPVDVLVRLDGDSLRFEVGYYDHRHELVIDPLVTTFSSFVGTTTDAGYDVVKALAVDSEGNTYIAGMTGADLQLNNAARFYQPAGSLYVPEPGDPANGCRNQCGYVVKINSRHEIVYSALMFWLDIRAIAVDDQQGVYLTGKATTGTRFPWTSSAYDAFTVPPAGAFFTPSAFVMKLNSAGSSLEFAHAIYGQEGTGIAVDAARNAYVIGTIISGSLVTTPGSLKPNYQDLGPGISNSDSFLLKITPDGQNLVYGTYLGGSGIDDALAITLSPEGRPVIAGRTESTDFVGMSGTLNGFSDGFILEISDDGSSVVRSRLIGGANAESVQAISRDNQGGYILGGVTTSEDFPVTPGVFQSARLGVRNGWVQRVGANFSPRYSTYFGGSQLDGVLAVASDPSGSAYFTGVSFSYDMPTTNEGFQDITSAVTTDSTAAAGRQYYARPTATVREAYFGVLTPDGTRLDYGTYLSGYLASDELSMGNAVVRHADGRVLAGGSTTSYGFPVTDGGLERYFPVSPGGYLVEFRPGDFHVSTNSLLPTLDLEGTSYSAQLNAAGGTPPYSWSVVGFRLPEGLSLSTSGAISGRWQTVMDGNGRVLNESGAYQFTTKVTDSRGLVSYKSLFIPVTTASRRACETGICRQYATLNEYVVFPVPIPARSVAPYTVSVTGNVPTGVSQLQNGNLEGAARTAGQYRFQLTTTDAKGKSVAITWELTVTDPGAVPQPIPAPQPVPTPGTPGGGSSGGGTSGLLSLLGLSLLLWRNRRV